MPSDHLTIFADSEICLRGVSLLTARDRERDLILAPEGASLDDTGLEGGEIIGLYRAFPADYGNMLIWDRALAPEPRLVALNASGHDRGFGAGNRMVASWSDLPGLRDRRTFAGWDGIFAAMLPSSAPFWFIQQSIVRELIPEGVSPEEHPGIGHTGGYGPRELLRAGLFAYASQGGYRRHHLPIGADADHAIITGRDEESLAQSLAFNRLAIAESHDYTKFTVDTSHLFDFPIELAPADRRRLLDAFSGRRFPLPNILEGRQALQFQFEEEDILRLGTRYWKAGSVHADIYRLVEGLKEGQPFDYELSLDETPEATPPRDLLFYLVMLQEVMGLPEGAIASAGPNLGFIKRHDFEGDLHQLRAQANACASVLGHFGAMLSVHSADGVRAATGKGPGVDEVLLQATGGRAELKVADVYQEVLWQVLAASPDAAERATFQEAWRRTHAAAGQLAAIWGGSLASLSAAEAQASLGDDHWQAAVARRQGEEALQLAQGVAGYGLPLFRLAADLLAQTDAAHPSPDAELFRRFMFLTYRGLRPAIFATLNGEGWQRLSDAIEEATVIRLRAMNWVMDGG